MKCIINNQVVLSRAPQGPLASHIGPFARSLSEQGYTLYSIHRQVLLAACFSDGLDSRESHYAVSPPIIRLGICYTVLGRCDRAWAMLPRSGICLIFCALRAWFPPRRSQRAR